MNSSLEEKQGCYRFLEDNEYHKLESIYKEHNDLIPSPTMSRIAIAESPEGEIVGFIANTFTPMITMWIKEEYRNQRVWNGLVEMMLPLASKALESGLKTYVIASQPQTVMMCEKLGLRRIEEPVYVFE